VTSPPPKTELTHWLTRQWHIHGPALAESQTVAQAPHRLKTKKWALGPIEALPLLARRTKIPPTKPPHWLKTLSMALGPI
jgi:hypothetical protein